jgi:excisionase family DNA binding protein
MIEAKSERQVVLWFRHKNIRQSVYSARQYHQLTTYDHNQSSHDVLTIPEAAQRLGTSTTSVKRLIAQKRLTATQVVARAP